MAGLLTQGDDLIDSMFWIVNAIDTWLDGLDEKDYSAPSKISDIDLSDYPDDSIVNVIEFDIEKYFHTIRYETTCAVARKLIVKEIQVANIRCQGTTVANKLNPVVLLCVRGFFLRRDNRIEVDADVVQISVDDSRADGCGDFVGLVVGQTKPLTHLAH